MKHSFIICAAILLITACKTHKKTISQVKTNIATDTIPFSVGKDNGIHVNAIVNNSEPLDFMFDTGANSFVITSSLIGKKVNIEIDDKAMNSGSDGSAMMEISTDDRIQIGDLNWENSPIISIPYQNHSFEGVIGLNAFENKIIEIDYDLNKLIIHNTSETIPSGYKKIESKKEFELFFFKALVDVDGNQTEDWFMYDTGSNSNLVLRQDFAVKQKLNNTMKVLGSGMSMGSTGIGWKLNLHNIPKFKLDSHVMNDILISINEKDPPGPHAFNILGSGIMKHFNTIIDLQNNTIYIKPNKQFDNPNTYKYK